MALAEGSVAADATGWFDTDVIGAPGFASSIASARSPSVERAARQVCSSDWSQPIRFGLTLQEHTVDAVTYITKAILRQRGDYGLVQNLGQDEVYLFNASSDAYNAIPLTASLLPIIGAFDPHRYL